MFISRTFVIEGWDSCHPLSSHKLDNTIWKSSNTSSSNCNMYFQVYIDSWWLIDKEPSHTLQGCLIEDPFFPLLINNIPNMTQAGISREYNLQPTLKMMYSSSTQSGGSKKKAWTDDVVFPWKQLYAQRLLRRWSGPASYQEGMVF